VFFSQQCSIHSEFLRIDREIIRECTAIIYGVSRISAVIRAVVIAKWKKMVRRIYQIIPIVTAPIDDFLWKKPTENLHVFPRHKRLCENTKVVIDGSGETDIAVFSENLNTIIHPTIRLERNIVATLIEVIAPFIICPLKENIPHLSQVPSRNIIEMNEDK
jgi:hypothetical protein